MWKFWIDTGGTFTDCLAHSPEGEALRAKVLSSGCVRAKTSSLESASDQVRIEHGLSLPETFFDGYRLRLLGGEASEVEVISWSESSGVARLSEPIGPLASETLCEFVSPEEPPILAARILTGTLLKEPLPKMEMRLATTRGTNALLERKGARTCLIVNRGFGDLLRIGNQQRPRLFELGIRKEVPLASEVIEVAGRIDACGKVIEELDTTELESSVALAEKRGFNSFAVSLMHGYKYPEHESKVAETLRKAGIRFASVSHQIAPFAKILPRAETCVVDAYLAPIMESYLDSVANSLGNAGGDRALRVMTSAGGLVSRSRYRPKDSLLSGPAGGVVGASIVGQAAGHRRTIAFDMGGTSTDVSRFDEALDYQFEQRIGPARVYAPSLRIETVAAGGGSICWFDGTALRVGPDSAGATPGPACYGAGGPLAITDVNLLLGRLDPDGFGIPVFPLAARERLLELKSQVELQTGNPTSEEALLNGFLAIANETMAEAIRKISTSEGFDPADYALVAFGGAGGLHACSVASILGATTILYPSDSGLLSAFGLKHALVEQFSELQVLAALQSVAGELANSVQCLRAEAAAKLLQDGFADEELTFQPPRFELRFRGQESTLTVESEDYASLETQFKRAYDEQFGFLPEDLPVELVAIRVVASSSPQQVENETFAANPSVKTSLEGQVIHRAELRAGDSVVGPVVVQDAFSTLFVDTDWQAVVGSQGTLKLERLGKGQARDLAHSEVVELELFTNRYLALVEDMGALLERAAFSTNVKERKDFSCALLDADGFLIANAPHIPVHLGALGVCVRTVLGKVELQDGDVVVTNHPAFGGSHLPDVTLIAPVFAEQGGELLGYVANRAHHAEIGGISPGSMPPRARNLEEEGVVIEPLKWVKAGNVDWPPLLELLEKSRYPSRSVAENVADLSAQLASIRCGQQALRDLAASVSPQKALRFMSLLKQRAATALSSALRTRYQSGVDALEAVERLDNGAEVRVQIRPANDGRWIIDFAGSAPEQANNYNATPAITTSAVMYVLRLLAKVDLPLNEGFLDVVDLRIPEGFLNPKFSDNPSACPAVVAGNVEVSQLIVTCLLKAFGLAAASQTTMNNFIFGSSDFGYYETIAGGEGATPSAPGASAVHTHMTNTAASDPEIMELRYPVRVEAFSVRKNSGGVGEFNGGDGVLKRIRFLEPVTLSLLTQRRTQENEGANGGSAGAKGEQRLILPNGEERLLDGNGSWNLEAQTVIEILTPGGGAWGHKD